MIKFFGLLSKKKKVDPKVAASIYVAALDSVIHNGFIEIKDFINTNNNLDASPNLTNKDITWFKNIVYLGNMQNLQIYFEESQSVIIRSLILDEIYKDLEHDKKTLSIENFLDYENYFTDLIRDNESPISAMAYAIFEKYNINNYQGDLFKRKNKPNPIFYNELKNLLKHFIWNWEDYLDKNKLVF
tara:strand:+ start:119 stop:676 length:558 start_codon:yes stop_codon:yes gene_type:complete